MLVEAEKNKIDEELHELDSPTGINKKEDAPK